MHSKAIVAVLACMSASPALAQTVFTGSTTLDKIAQPATNAAYEAGDYNRFQVGDLQISGVELVQHGDSTPDPSAVTVTGGVSGADVSFTFSGDFAGSLAGHGDIVLEFGVASTDGATIDGVTSRFGAFNGTDFVSTTELFGPVVAGAPTILGAYNLEYSGGTEFQVVGGTLVKTITGDSFAPETGLGLQQDNAPLSPVTFDSETITFHETTSPPPARVPEPASATLLVGVVLAVFRAVRARRTAACA